jgi:hypothetical protein
LQKEKIELGEAPHLFMKEGSLLALPIGKRLCIYVGFGLKDKNLAHSLANVK